MQTDELRRDTAAFRQAGGAIDDPKPLARVRPDGYKLSWVLSIPRDAQRGVAPFLIQDETPREERVPRQMPHRNQVRGIGAVTVAVSDVAPVRQWYARVLGAGGQDVSRDDLTAAGARFTIGPHLLDFVGPRGAGCARPGRAPGRGAPPPA